MTRFEAIAALVPPGFAPVVDVGADHGRVAARLGAIATERRPHRRSNLDVRWVVADGLAPFRHVGTAVIAGMGWATIARILSGPTPVRAAVLHADDDPPALRLWLAANGWRIDAEVLAPVSRRAGAGIAEIVRAFPGHEPAIGLELHYGPRLLESADPRLGAHLATARRRWERVIVACGPTALAVAADAERHVAFLRERERLWNATASGKLEA